MSFKSKLVEELKAVGVTTLYFAVWFVLLVIVKSLILAEYQIEFRGLSLALIGALIVAKVVLIAGHVPLGSWVMTRPRGIEVLARTAIYSVGVVIVLLLEKSFEARHEYGGFGSALRQIFDHRDIHHVWANAICVSAALLSFNVLIQIRMRLGEGGLRALLLGDRNDTTTTLPRASSERTRANERG